MSPVFVRDAWCHKALLADGVFLRDSDELNRLQNARSQSPISGRSVSEPHSIQWSIQNCTGHKALLADGVFLSFQTIAKIPDGIPSHKALLADGVFLSSWQSPVCNDYRYSHKALLADGVFLSYPAPESR